VSSLTANGGTGGWFYKSLLGLLVALLISLVGYTVRGNERRIDTLESRQAVLYERRVAQERDIAVIQESLKYLTAVLDRIEKKIDRR